MKKLIFVMFALGVFAVGVTSCGGEKAEDSTEAEAGSEDAPAEGEESAE